jgi:hypothetical protein
MSVTGKIKNGVVVLPPGTKLPEGADVKVETFERGYGRRGHQGSTYG